MSTLLLADAHDRGQHDRDGRRHEQDRLLGPRGGTLIRHAESALQRTLRSPSAVLAVEVPMILTAKGALLVASTNGAEAGNACYPAALRATVAVPSVTPAAEEEDLMA
jgi:hypothetical protein